VDRNRTKRILRSISQETGELFPTGYDIALIAHRSIDEIKYPDRVKLLVKALKKIQNEVS
jgi:ribonuclease P protein component